MAMNFFRGAFLQHDAEMGDSVRILMNQKVTAPTKICLIIKPYAFGIKAGPLNQFRHRQSILILVIQVWIPGSIIYYVLLIVGLTSTMTQENQ